MDIADLRAKITLDTSQFTAGVLQAKTAMQQLGSGSQAAVSPLSSSLKDATGALQQFGRQAQSSLSGLQGLFGPALTAGITGFAAVTLKASLDVANAMNAIRTATGATGEALAGLEDSFEKVGASVPNSLADVGTAMAGFARLTGESGKPLEALSTQALNLNRILGADVKSTVTDSARLFAQWGVSVGDQGKVLDALFRATQSGSADFGTLEKSLVRFAPALKSLGLSFGDSAALLAAFNREGVNTDRAMQGLNMAMTRWAKAGITDLHGALLNLFGAIERAPSAGKALQVALSAGLSSRGASDVVNAIRSGGLAYGDLLKQIERGHDTINKAAKDTETFGTGFGKLRNQVELALAPLGKGLGGALADLGENLKPILSLVRGVGELFGKLPAPVRLGTAAFAALAPVVGPQLAGAIGLGVAAVDGLAGAWKNDFGGIRTSTEQFIDWVKPALLFAWEQIVKDAKLAWKEVSDTIAGVWDGLRQNVLPVVLAFGQGILAALAAPFQLLKRLFDLLPAAVKNSLGQVGQAIAGAAAVFDPRNVPAALAAMRQAYLQEHPDYGKAGPAAAGGGRRRPGDQLTGDGAPPDVGKQKKTDAQKEEERATELIARNARILAFLHRGESVDVARLAGEYLHLGASRLQEVVASQRQVDAAVKTAESRKEFLKDLAKTNAEIRRLAAGHAAEGGALDALVEKYPGLTAAQYQAMNAADQWKLHLEAVRKEAVRLGEAFRSLNVAAMRSQTTSEVGSAAVDLFGEPFARRYGKRSATDLWNNLTPAQRQAARLYAGEQEGTSIGGALQQMQRQTTEQSYRTRTNQIAYQYFDRSAERLSPADLAQVHRYETREATQQQTAAGDQLRQAQRTQVNTVIGSADDQLTQLQQQFAALTGRSAAARQVMQQFGVTLRELPQSTQATLRGLLDLQHGMQFLQDLGSGVESVFDNVFTRLTHGFKGFFGTVVQGFEGMLQQIAAKYLASQAANLFLHLLGPALGGLFGGGGSGSVVGRAAGGSFGTGQPLLVGEYGPEMIFPSRPGYVMPNAQVQGTRGGDLHIHQHMTVVTPDASSFRKSQGQILADLHRAAERAHHRNG